MKPVLSKELLKRLRCASINGSRVASKILSEIERCGDNDISTIVGTKANYFESRKRVRHGHEDSYGFTELEIVISCCNKDLENPRFPDYGNPSAPYLSENRCDLSPTRFAKTFSGVVDDDSITDLDYEFFDSIIRVNSVVHLSIVDSVEEISAAYAESNYYMYAESKDDTPLHRSCMRHEDRNLPSRVADFYVNFAGARLLVASDDNGSILGRAVVWDEVNVESIGDGLSLLDRIYTCFKAVRRMMISYARNCGIVLRKYRDTYDNKDEFIFLSDYCSEDCEYSKDEYVEAGATVNLSYDKFNKQGCPYLDTFTFLFKSIDSDSILLSNGKADLRDCYLVCDFTKTGGTAAFYCGICPVCGNKSDFIRDVADCICESCKNEIKVETFLGTQFNCHWIQYDGKYYPEQFFDADGNPKPSFLLHKRLQRFL